MKINWSFSMLYIVKYSKLSKKKKKSEYILFIDVLKKACHYAMLFIHWLICLGIFIDRRIVLTWNDGEKRGELDQKCTPTYTACTPLNCIGAFGLTAKPKLYSLLFVVLSRVKGQEVLCWWVTFQLFIFIRSTTVRPYQLKLCCTLNH